jgi:predicted site-specific integrase-resolvase
MVYSHESSQDQKEDLARQTQELKKYCEEKQKNNAKIIEDIGSEINCKKKGLRK